MTRNQQHLLRQLLTGFAVAALLLVPGSATADDEYPESATEAMAHYESRVEDWADGPVGWIMLEDEQERWEDLTSASEKAAFIDWFWDRRDADLRTEGNAFKEAFYQRVADSNRRYAGFPRGWKSDRGRIHVVIGKPDALRPAIGGDTETVVWTYYTTGVQGEDSPFGSLDGEIEIAFVRTGADAGYELYSSFGGAGSMPLYVQEALEYAKRAYVVDWQLEPGATGSES